MATASFHPSPSKPKLRLPRGACDTHLHLPVVIDHMARIDASLGLSQKPFRPLLGLLEDPKVWVKVSGCECISRQTAPWKDALPFARQLMAEFGGRALWGTDWPHSNLKEVPDDGLLVGLIGEIAPTEAQREALLVGNPQRFYGFKKRRNS